jgi:hypothetical protein
VLGALDPDHIVVVGDRIKLSTDALRDADNSSPTAKTYACSATFWPESTEATSAFPAYQIVSTMECWCQARFDKVGDLAKCINSPPASQPILRDGKTRPKRPCGPSHAKVRRLWPNLHFALTCIVSRLQLATAPEHNSFRLPRFRRTQSFKVFGFSLISCR